MKIFHLLKNNIYVGNENRYKNNYNKNFLSIIVNKFNIFSMKKFIIHLFLYKKYIKKIISEKKKILFISTKNFLREIIYKYARSLNQYYICNKWIPGILTNSINYKKILNQSFLLKKKKKLNFTKKEKNIFIKKQIKIENIYSGLRTMIDKPDLIIITDIKKDKIAIKEANRLNIKILALLNSDDSPLNIDFKLYCNNNSIFSIKKIFKILFSELC
ncbi:MAG: 30S ribosomal protein S2 [Candidatus Carsonella ruddii]